jgi:hypothetical protein
MWTKFASASWWSFMEACFLAYLHKTSTNTEETSGHIATHRCWWKLILKAFSQWRRSRCRTRDAMATGHYVQLKVFSSFSDVKGGIRIGVWQICSPYLGLNSPNSRRVQGRQ